VLLLRLVTLNNTTFGRNPLDKVSARRRDLYLNNTQHSQETKFHALGENQTPNPAIYLQQTSAILVSTLTETYSVSIGKRNPTMKFREIISVFSENHTCYKHSRCEQNSHFFNSKCSAVSLVTMVAHRRSGF
jgi:hypothetical protein